MMKSIYMFIAFCIITYPTKAQQVLIANNAKVSFFSSTVLEDIEGKSSTGASVIETQTGRIIFKVNNTSFQFKKKLMQEHFNENYMESDRYPVTDFKGIIKDPLDFTKDGTKTVSVEGVLNIHGIAKTYKVPATLSMSKGVLSANALFKVKIADHGIEIPSIVFKNIAEYVEVRIQATYQAKK